jgi:hypothetical protein
MAESIILHPATGHHPNPDLVKMLALLLAKARSGEVTDAVIIACSADYTEFMHHYSVAEHENMTTMIGELDLFKDVMKGQVHQTRAKAALIKNTGSLAGG